MSWLTGPPSTRPWAYERPARLQDDVEWWAAANTGGVVHRVVGVSLKYVTQCAPEGYSHRVELIARTACGKPHVLHEHGRRCVPSDERDTLVDNRGGPTKGEMLPICWRCADA